MTEANMKRLTDKSHKKYIPGRRLLIGGLLGLLLLVGLVRLGLPVWLRQPLSLPDGRQLQAQVNFDQPGPYRIGDLIRVTLEIRAVNGVTYAMPDWASNSMGRLELKSKSAPQTVRYRGGSGQKIVYKLTSWETGQFTLPALSFKYRTKEGQNDRYTIPASKITIASVLPKGRTKAQLLALQPKKIKPPVGLPPAYRQLWYLAAIGAILGVIMLLFFWWRKYRPTSVKAETQIPTAPEPAHIIALRRLNNLKKQDFLAQGNFQAYYFELSECLRAYLEGRFQINALEMTTEESLDYLSNDQLLPGGCRQILRHFLQASDLIKFAKHLPEPAEAAAAWEEVYQIVDTTKQEPPAPETATVN
jgi:hypothetical protein